ncbi:hypothetical protein [Desulfosporosinus metallidurans]|uniref:Uncharacterized protein n=1 Tax=Desulfosporosinus metallidurans TaxID=1888891 RepID=A0A1Q8QDJ2_9FIRM|nr:hypothetical protein [Desulfosporosinus metallidurans]OLN25413.1 hypothetical protein DSOL_5323 [Desulfosporosinus metallidurans]
MSELEDKNKREQNDYKNFSRMIRTLEKQTETSNLKIKDVILTYSMTEAKELVRSLYRLRHVLKTKCDLK